MNPLLALAHPGLLWTGLALVGVPVLIHLFFRRRHRVVRWAAMTFLLAALKKQKRRIEIENLLLLLLRCAVIALLALAIARPAVQAASLNPFGGGARAVLLVIDTSASMGAVHTGRSALERARERAGRLLGELPEGSRTTLIVTRDDGLGGAPRSVLENARPAEARARLAGLRLSHGAHRLGDVFRLASAKLTALRGRRLIVFVTDLQRRDWLTTAGDAPEDVFTQLMTLGREGEQRPPVVLLDVGRDDTANVALAGFTVDEGREAFAPSLLWLSAALVNYGPTSAEGNLTLYLARAADGRWEKKESRRVELPPAPDTAAVEPHVVQLHQHLRAGSEGPTRFRVVFEPALGATDRLKGDDERYLALTVRPPVRVLPVRSVTGATELLRDVADAIDVVEFAEPIHPAVLGDQDLSRYDVVLWADAEIHSLEPAAVRKLEVFVRRGGGLLAYLGTYATPGRVNELFYRERGQGLFPMLLADERMRVDDANPVRIDVLDEHTQAHPLFRDTDKAALFYSPEILGFVRVRKEFLADESWVRAHVVAHYDTPGADPAVLQHRLGEGRVIIVTTTPDERAMRQNGSLLPAVLFFNAAHLLVREDLSLRNVEVGAPVRIALPPGARRVVVDPPDGAGGRTEEPVEDDAHEFLLADTAQPGFYRVTVKGVNTTGAGALPEETVHLAAANAQPGEGDLRRANRVELQRKYRRTSLVFAREVEEALPEAAAAGEGGDETSRGLLGAVVVLLFLELALAWRFGSRRRAVV